MSNQMGQLLQAIQDLASKISGSEAKQEQLRLEAEQKQEQLRLEAEQKQEQLRLEAEQLRLEAEQRRLDSEAKFAFQFNQAKIENDKKTELILAENDKKTLIIVNEFRLLEEKAAERFEHVSRELRIIKRGVLHIEEFQVKINLPGAEDETLLRLGEAVTDLRRDDKAMGELQTISELQTEINEYNKNAKKVGLKPVADIVPPKQRQKLIAMYALCNPRADQSELNAFGNFLGSQLYQAMGFRLFGQYPQDIWQLKTIALCFAGYYYFERTLKARMY